MRTDSGGRSIPTNSGTNRLSGSVSYDNAGNLLSWNGNLYEYDPLHMMKRLTTPGGEDWLYVYTADDERVWMYDLVGTTSRYTLRGLGGKVLREYTVASDYWTRERDYVYSNGQLFAAETPQGLRHFYTDHLGTPRLVTDASGNQVAYHVYYPFGEEATSPVQDQERMKFTGHERDLADPSGTGDDLDYMHARFCSSITGRFLSVDPSVGRPEFPQSWNGYNYVWNNPLLLIDPFGETVYVVLYTTGNDRGDDELRRAAETRADEIRNRDSFDPETDTVILRGVKSKADFIAAIDDANSLDARFGGIGSLALFSHGGDDGPVFHDSSGAVEQFEPTDSELGKIAINWEPYSCALFYACNSAQGFAQRFATAQEVVTFGYEGYANFSSDRSKRAGVKSSGPVYMVYAAGLSNDGVKGWIIAHTGFGYNRGLTRRDP